MTSRWLTAAVLAVCFLPGQECARSVARNKAGGSGSADFQGGIELIPPGRNPVPEGFAYLSNWKHVQQEFTYWCWAAVASGVSAYYDGDKSLMRCEVATRLYAGKDCCEKAGECNIPQALDTALQTIGHFREEKEGPASLDELREELVTKRRPVCVRVAWEGDRGHFVAIIGMAGNTLIVSDPQEQSLLKCDYEQFCSNYKMHGRWDDTYFTQ